MALAGFTYQQSFCLKSGTNAFFYKFWPLSGNRLAFGRPRATQAGAKLL
jgi:hypothetical protein